MSQWLCTVALTLLSVHEFFSWSSPGSVRLILSANRSLVRANFVCNFWSLLFWFHGWWVGFNNDGWRHHPHGRYWAASLVRGLL